jgi:hypothetical protein
LIPTPRGTAGRHAVIQRTFASQRRGYAQRAIGSTCISMQRRAQDEHPHMPPTGRIVKLPEPQPADRMAREQSTDREHHAGVVPNSVSATPQSTKPMAR